MGKGPNDFRPVARPHHARRRGQPAPAGTDWLDLYYLHHVDVQTPLEEMLRALDDLVRQGKVRYPAVSNFEAWRLMEALWLSQANGWAPPACYQPQYSLVVRDIEQEIVPVCDAQGPRRRGVVAARRRLPRPAATARASTAPPARAAKRTGRSRCAISTRRTTPSWPNCWRSRRNSAARRRRWRCAGCWSGRGFRAPSSAAATRGSSRTACRPRRSGCQQEALQRLDQVSALPHRYPRSMEEGMAKRRDDAVGRG